MIQFVKYSLPPSAKFILKVIQEKGQITPKDLVRETALPKRTVAYALKKLKENHLIMERFNLNDMRQRYYIASVLEEVPISFANCLKEKIIISSV